MDLRWLTADEHELEAAIENLAEDDRPELNPRHTMLPLALHLVLLGYLGIALLVFNGSIDEAGDPPVEAHAVAWLVFNLLVFVGLWYATVRFGRWWDRPRHETKVRMWREHLTGLVNDVEIEPVHRATFVSLITGHRRTAACYPRFTAPGVEFGNLTSRTHSVLEWHYLAVQLPAPLPHLILESTAVGPLPPELGHAPDDQVVPVGYPFEASFTVHAPRGYAHDALYVLTPAVMAVLMDHAAGFHIETIGDTLVFFAPERADFATPEPWQAIDALWMHAVPALNARAERYRDERVPEQALAHRLLSLQEAHEQPGRTWDTRRIAPAGERLDRPRPKLRRFMVKKYGGEYLLVWVAMAPLGLAMLGIVLTAHSLYEAFVAR